MINMKFYFTLSYQFSSDLRMYVSSTMIIFYHPLHDLRLRYNELYMHCNRKSTSTEASIDMRNKNY
jgi:hypothetical protein